MVLIINTYRMGFIGIKAKEVNEYIIYIFNEKGIPRIVQTNNGKNFSS